MALRFVDKPVRAIGGFFAMTGATFAAAGRRPFAWQEFSRQVWRIARVSLLPICMLAIPFAVLVVFIIDFLLFRSAHLSTHMVLVVAGAGATVVCAEVGAYGIRDEVDEVRGRGIDPIPAVVLPRVLAISAAAMPLAFVAVAITGVFFFSVFGVHTPVSQLFHNLMGLVRPLHLLVGVVESGILGLCGGLIACYRHITYSGQPN